MRELALLAALLASAEAAAQSQEPGLDAPPPRAPANTARDFSRFAFNFYDQKDGGGNPHLDEDMTVLEPQLLVGIGLADHWTGSFKFQSDIISAASVEKGKRFPAGTQSGASGDKYVGGEMGLFYAWSDQTIVGGGLSISNEYDYQSTGAFLKAQFDSASKNDTFVGKVSVFNDTLDLILFDGSEEGSDSRRSVSFGLGWTRVMGPETVGTLNWDITTQSGFLSTPYNSVFVAGTEVREVLPDSRLRNAFFGRVRQLLFEDLAVEPGLGFYFDDWGATALNAEFNLFWEPIPGTLIVRPTYRFHSQTEVDDFTDEGETVIPEFRTQDSDLADFTSHTIGIKFLFPDVRLFGMNHEIEFGFDWTSRSDDLNALSFTLGYQWRF